MPSVSTQNSPRETYPFRPSSSSVYGMSASEHLNKMSTNPPSSLGSYSLRENAFRDPIRDIQISPGPRGSVGTANVVGSRGSLSSLASIGTLSTRASMGSVGSLSSGESVSTLPNEGSASMWHNGEESPATSAISNSAPSSATSIGPQKHSLGATGTVPSSSAATLHVSSLPRDLTLRECHFLFALVPEFVSVEMNRNAVSGEVSVAAKFSTLHSAQAAAQAFERRNDLFGYDIKTNVQPYPAPFGGPSQAQQSRNLYNSRPLFAESYWTQGTPGTPLSPSGTTDVFSGSRRPSLISPTDHTTSQMGSMSLTSTSPTSQQYESSYFGLSESNGSNTSLPLSNSNGSSSNSSAFFVQPGQNGTSISPTSKVTSSSSSSPLSGSAPISSTAASNSSGPIGSVVNAQQDIGPNSTHFSYRHQPQQPMAQTSHGDVTKIPPPNPADQNPPCNTLYVGNLPPDTSENELKELFSQQPGYRRLCFRTKQNGPMCFVEFDDEKLAGKALSELYGVALSNSVKGGIRLSYSKNPLGVRSRPVRSK